MSSSNVCDKGFEIGPKRSNREVHLGSLRGTRNMEKQVQTEDEDLKVSDTRNKIIKSKMPGAVGLGGKFYSAIANVKGKSSPKWQDGKRQYLTLQDNVLKDTPGSDIPVGSDSYRSMMRDHVLPDAIGLAQQLYDNHIMSGPAFNFPKKFYDRRDVSKSEFFLHKLAEDLSGYKSSEIKRRVTPMPPHPEAVKVYVEHCKRMEQAIDHIGAMLPEDQHAEIISRLPPNKNAGWPFFYHQTKDNALDLIESLLEGLSVRDRKRRTTVTAKNFCLKRAPNAFVKKKLTYVTVDLVMAFVEFLLLPTVGNSQGTFPPYIIFYRTSAGAKTTVRSIFGSWFGLKIIGMLMSAAKKQEGFEYVKIGDLPFMAGVNWDSLFDSIISAMEKDPESTEWAGEDFKRFDNHLTFQDFAWIPNDNKLQLVAPKYQKIISYCIYHMLYADTWIDKLRIKGSKVLSKEEETWMNELWEMIFYNSGNPWTSEGGTFAHMNFTFIVRDETGWQLKHATFLSDDNLTGWCKNFDINTLILIAERYNFVIDPEDTFVYSRDKAVSFLKVWIGPLLKGSPKLIAIGDLNSRALSQLHSEREVEEYGPEAGFGSWIVMEEDVPINRVVNQILGKLGSMGKAALPIIKAILDHEEFKAHSIGKLVLSAIHLMKMGIVEPRLARDDLPSTWSPKILADINITAVDLKGQASND